MPMRSLFVFLCLIIFFPTNAQSDLERDKNEILAVLYEQEQAWNNYDLEGFMKGYWKSNSLKFYGSGGVTSGWENTLSNYHKRYPSSEHTGNLKFNFDNISPIGKKSYYVMGRYHLTREMGDANGIFMIVLKKIKGEWKIIADTSASAS